VQPITSGGLCHLHTPNCGITVQHHLQVWSGLQRLLQSADFYPKSVPRDLYHRPQQAPAQANRRRRSREALIANYARFGGSSILHYHYKRDQPSIREVGKLQPSARLVKDQMVRQADVFKVWAK